MKNNPLSALIDLPSSYLIMFKIQFNSYEIGHKTYNLTKNMSKQCEKHNLPEDIVCIGEMCNKRIGCQLCIDKHDHKFYLDTKFNQKNVGLVREQI